MVFTEPVVPADCFGQVFVVVFPDEPAPVPEESNFANCEMGSSYPP